MTNGHLQHFLDIKVSTQVLWTLDFEVINHSLHLFCYCHCYSAMLQFIYKQFNIIQLINHLINHKL